MGRPSANQNWLGSHFWMVSSTIGRATWDSNRSKALHGHSARATGAVHLASTQVELWRIQLFGRWGSEAFKLYVRNAPLSQLHLLAQESSVQTAISKAKAELAAMVKQLESLGQWQASQRMAEQPIQCLLDCESAAPIVPAHESAEALFVMNRRRSGKLHRVTHYGGTVQHYLWHSACFWYFARHDANYALLKAEPENAPKCAKCFRTSQTSSSDNSSDSESSGASQVGRSVGRWLKRGWFCIHRFCCQRLLAVDCDPSGQPIKTREPVWSLWMFCCGRLKQLLWKTHSV